MGKCVVKSCLSRTVKSGEYPIEDDISFHRMPKHDKTLRAKWIEVIRLLIGEDSWTPPDKAIICSKHFKYEDRIIKEGSKPKLKKDAVPELERDPLSQPFKIEILSDDEECQSYNTNYLPLLPSIPIKIENVSDDEYEDTKPLIYCITSKPPLTEPSELLSNKSNSHSIKSKMKKVKTVSPAPFKDPPCSDGDLSSSSEFETTSTKNHLSKMSKCKSKLSSRETSSEDIYSMRISIHRLLEQRKRKSDILKNLRKKHKRLKSRHDKLMELVKSLNDILTARKKK